MNALEVLFGADRLQKVRILMLLSGRAMYAAQMARELNLDQATIAGHIKDLEEAGFITSDRLGPLKMYRLTELAEREILPHLKKLAEMRISWAT